MSNFTDDLKQKYQQFMKDRNGPDQLARDCVILAVVLIVLGVLIEPARTFFMVLGLATLGYAYFRMFSANISKRGDENSAYLTKREEILGKVKGKVGAPLSDAAKKGKQMAEQAKDKEHRYFECPKCKQSIRVPKGAGKIRVTCPKCGEKFEKKA